MDVWDNLTAIFEILFSRGDIENADDISQEALDTLREIYLFLDGDGKPLSPKEIADILLK